MALAPAKRTSMESEARSAYYKLAEVLESNPGWADTTISTDHGPRTLAEVQRELAGAFLPKVPELRRSIPTYRKLRGNGELDHVAIVEAGSAAWDCASDMRRFSADSPELAEIPIELGDGVTVTPKAIGALCSQAGEAAK